MYIHNMYFCLRFWSRNCCWSSGLIHPHTEWQMLFLPKNTFLLAAFLFQCSLLAWFKGMKWTQECVCGLPTPISLKKNSIQITKESVEKKLHSVNFMQAKKKCLYFHFSSMIKISFELVVALNMMIFHLFTLQISIYTYTQKYHVQNLIYNFCKFTRGYWGHFSFEITMYLCLLPSHT